MINEKNNLYGTRQLCVYQKTGKVEVISEDVLKSVRQQIIESIEKWVYIVLVSTVIQLFFFLVDGMVLWT